MATQGSEAPRLEKWLGIALLAVGVIFVVALVGMYVVRPRPEYGSPGIGGVLAQNAGMVKPSDLLFYLLAAIVVISAAGVAFSTNVIYSALSLLGALLGSGALYLYLRADYVAITQLLIYIGGVLVLILFAVMLTSRIEDIKHSNPRVGMLPGIALLVATVVLLTFVATRAPWKVTGVMTAETTASTIGDAFLGPYLLPFEVASLVLLATLIGAVVVARKEIKE